MTDYKEHAHEITKDRDQALSDWQAVQKHIVETAKQLKHSETCWHEQRTEARGWKFCAMVGWTLFALALIL